MTGMSDGGTSWRRSTGAVGAASTLRGIAQAARPAMREDAERIVDGLAVSLDECLRSFGECLYLPETTLREVLSWAETRT